MSGRLKIKIFNRSFVLRTKSPDFERGRVIKMNGNAAFDALEYDGEIKKTLPYYECFYKQVIDLVKVQWKKPLTWLDLGCGTGKMAEAAFETIDIKKFVFCDSSADMIDIVKKRFKDKSAEFITSSVMKLDAIDKFDVITSIQVFHYLQREERAEAVKKCYKALNPNGFFITFENFAPYSEAGKRLFLERWKKYQLSQGKDVKECDSHISRYGKNYFPITISEHLKVLEQSGFANVEIIWVSNMQVGLLGIK